MALEPGKLVLLALEADFLLEIPALLLIGEALVNMKTHAIIF